MFKRKAEISIKRKQAKKESTGAAFYTEEAMRTELKYTPMPDKDLYPKLQQRLVLFYLNVLKFNQSFGFTPFPRMLFVSLGFHIGDACNGIPFYNGFFGT